MKKPTFKISDLLVLVLIVALSTISFTSAYPASIPAHGYFIIEGIPIIFWPAYFILLITNYYFIVSRKVHNVIKILSYYLLSFFALIRMFITPYVSGIFGSDSSTYIGLVDYWISNDIINLQETAYGDNPSLFIISKVFNCIAKLNIKYLTFILALLWVFLIFMAFRLFVLKHQGRHNTVSYDTKIITSWMSLSYFLLTVFFIVNFQFAPQSFALVLLILAYLSIYNKSNITTSDIVLVTTLFLALLVSHPFMYIFLMTSIGLMYFMLKITNKLWPIFNKLTRRNLNKAFSKSTLIILIVFITSSIIYLLYLAYRLQVKLSDVILRAFKHPLYATALEHYRIIATPLFPEYHPLYLAITYVVYIGLVILTIYITFFALIGLRIRTCKLYEISITLAPLIWVLPSSAILGGLSLRGLQTLLLGLLLLAVHGLTLYRKKHEAMFKKVVTRLITLTVLANVKYMSYAHPPYFSDSDITVAELLNDFIIPQGNKILSHRSLHTYFNSRFTGNLFTAFTSPYWALIGNVDVSSLWVLWSNKLELESIKHCYPLPKFSYLVKSRDLVFSSNIAYLLY